MVVAPVAVPRFQQALPPPDTHGVDRDPQRLRRLLRRLPAGRMQPVSIAAQAVDATVMLDPLASQELIGPGPQALFVLRPDW